jgi:MscS family membrane protein
MIFAENLSDNASSVAGELVSSFTSLNLGPLTDTLYMGNTLLQYIIFSIIILASFLAGKTVYFVLKHKLQAMAQRTNTRLDDILIKITQGPLMMAIVILGVMYGIQVLVMPAWLFSFLTTVLSVLVSVTLLWFVMRLIDSLVDEYMHPLTAKTDSKLDDQMVPIVKKVLKALVLIFGLISIASNFGYDLTALITGLGIGGLAIALAAQQTLGNMFGGVSIFMDRPFTVGDRIKVNDIVGDIIEVGSWSSKIKNLDNNIVIIPNSILSNSIVENYARPTKKLKQKFKIGLVYGTKPAKVEQAVTIIKEAISTTEGVAPDEPLVYFTEFGDFSLGLTCIYWIKSLKYWGSNSHEINMKILKEFEKAGIEIAFPTQTIHLEK